MPATIIKVENLGKKYTISHEGRESYTTLRDVISNNIRRLFKSKQQRLIAGEEEDFWALKDVNFEIKQGEAVGIIGRNGAGKSTLLKILSRITEPSTGRITINGRVASLLEVGTGFHPELTGRENIYLNGAILGMGRAEIKKKFDEIVDFSGVEKFLDTPVKRYSSGMYVRLAFAVAAHLEPEILVVDEVLAVGDAEFQKKCLGKMNDVSQKEGRTVLFVSHNMAAIKEICPSGILLNNGMIDYKGQMDSTINAYIKNRISSNIKGEVSSLMRTINTGEAFIRKLIIIDENQSIVEEVLYKKNIIIQITIEVVKILSNPLIDIKIISPEGIVIVHNIFDMSKCSDNILKKGNRILHVNIENHLAPGNYSMTAGIHYSNGTTIEYVEDIYPFHVMKIAANSVESYQFNWVFGYYHPKSTWKIIN